MPSFFARTFSFLYLTFVFASSALFFIVALVLWLVTFPFDKKRRVLHYFTCCWASLYLWLAPHWRFSVTGREHVDRNQTYIMISNHQSVLDIPSVFRLFLPFKWVSKAEVFQVPFIGWNMWLNGYIGLKRGNKDSIRQMLKHCEDNLRAGNSIFIFPEGTRSADGEVKAFKPGAFTLAKKLGVPILPIVLHNTRHAMPKASMQLGNKAHITLEILAPIDVRCVEQYSQDELAQQAQQQIRQALSRAQQPQRA